MKTPRSIRVAASAAATLLILAAAGAPVTATAQAMADCHAIAAAAERLACYDRLTGRSAQDTAPAAAAASRPPDAIGAEQAAQARSAAPLPPAAKPSMIDTAWDFDPQSPRYDIRFYNPNYFLFGRYTDNPNKAPYEAFAAAPKPGQEKVMAWMKEGLLAGDLKLEHGWTFTTKTGLYGTNYRQRALVTAIGLGANRPQDAVYPTSEGPDLLKKYDGSKKYVMRFNKGELPPVDGFWSVTMYNAEYFFVANPLNRFNVSQRNKFKLNADGSVDIHIQHESPGKDREANWLPAPKDKFVLMMRLYWPKETPPSILDGTWKIPEVKEVS